MSIFFKTFEVGYFRSFSKKQKLFLGVPDGKKEGSGLTIIVGPNNVGKTTLIEAMLKDKNKTVYEEDKVGSREPIFVFTKTDRTEIKITTIKKGSAQLSGINMNFQIVPSRRDWSNSAGGQSEAEETTSNNYDVRSMNGINVANKLAWLETNKEKLIEYNFLLKKIFSNFYDWTISESRNIGKYISYTTLKGKKHAFDITGQGISSVFRILLHLITDRIEQPLIIDEPELSLQPEAQRKLLKVIAECAKSRQIIISTHSPYFINFFHFKNGARIARINKPNDDISIVNNLGEYSNYKSLLGGDNWQQPFLMNEVAKDVFFNDNILFVEGHEDVGLIMKYYKEVLKKEIPFNIFGYGVRGKDNFKFGCKLSKDLGLQKVAVLIDNGQKEKVIWKELVKEYKNKKPYYEVVQHGKFDMRDKECSCCKNESCKNHKEGYFEVTGKIKKKEAENFKKIVDMIENYFKQ